MVSVQPLRYWSSQIFHWRWYRGQRHQTLSGSVDFLIPVIPICPGLRIIMAMARLEFHPIRTLSFFVSLTEMFMTTYLCDVCPSLCCELAERADNNSSAAANVSRSGSNFVFVSSVLIQNTASMEETPTTNIQRWAHQDLDESFRSEWLRANQRAVHIRDYLQL